MSAYEMKNCQPNADRQAVIDLFYAVKEELYLPDRSAVEKMVDLIFAHGGVVGGYYAGQLVGAMGYFFGDPSEQFADKSILFMYVGAILPEHRGSRLFLQGLRFSLRQMQATPVAQIRLQAEAANSFTNRLYSRFAKPVGRSRSLRGVEVITYGNELGAALRTLGIRPARVAAPTPHASIPTPRTMQLSIA